MIRLIDQKVFPIMAAAAVISMMAAMGLIFFYAPLELTMGIVQKIFYVHVPSAMATYAGFTIASVCSFFYLVRPHRYWDMGAVAGAEVGLIFCIYVLISGPLWAYKA
ncbi:MAG: cytochrome c biogenesis protein CcsA, partial [Bradymonadaceae bacterium]